MFAQIVVCMTKTSFVYGCIHVTSGANTLSRALTIVLSLFSLPVSFYLSPAPPISSPSLFSSLPPSLPPSLCLSITHTQQIHTTADREANRQGFHKEILHARLLSLSHTHTCTQTAADIRRVDPFPSCMREIFRDSERYVVFETLW